MPHSLQLILLLALKNKVKALKVDPCSLFKQTNSSYHPLRLGKGVVGGSSALKTPPLIQEEHFKTQHRQTLLEHLPHYDTEILTRIRCTSKKTALWKDFSQIARSVASSTLKVWLWPWPTRMLKHRDSFSCCSGECSIPK